MAKYTWLLLRGKSEKIKRLLLTSIFMLFILTLTLNVTSLFYSPLHYYDTHTTVTVDTTDQVPGYGTRLRDISQLKKAITQPMEHFDIKHATALVFESLIHSDQRQTSVFENWVLWLLGKFYEPLSRTQSPDRIVAGGLALCCQAALVLNKVATINGASARTLALSGHVISDIKVGDKWVIADPDYGIVFPFGYDEFVHMDEKYVKETLARLLAERGFTKEGTLEAYAHILLSKENHTVIKPGEALSPKLWLIESYASIAAWLITVFLGVLFLVLYRYSKKERKRNT